MNSVNYENLSKTIAHALRHEPQLYHLKLDTEGWVLLSDLISSLNTKGVDITIDSINRMIEFSEKKRYEIKDDKIRAIYGHSTKDKIEKKSQLPPIFLYHGTIESNRNNILKKGILPMLRQYVHLSTDQETAKEIATRRKGEILIIIVQALEAYRDNIKFYKEENGIWLADQIPAKYIIL